MAEKVNNINFCAIGCNTGISVVGDKINSTPLEKSEGGIEGLDGWYIYGDRNNSNYPKYLGTHIPIKK